MALGAAPGFAAGLAAMVLVGALASAFQSLNNSLTMSLSDHQYIGRVQGISMLSWSLFGLVALPIGILADHIGIQATLVLMGAAVFAGVALLELVMARQPSVFKDRTRPAAVAESVAGATGGR
jgi:sugar phosphate permease